MKRGRLIETRRDWIRPGSPLNKNRTSPLRLLAVILLAVFAAEILVMSILSQLPPISGFLEGLMDALVLVILVFPILFFYFFQPLLQEIDERRRTEAALHQSNQSFERLFSITHVLVAHMDREFTFIRVNRAYAEADLHDPDFYLGKKHFDLFPNRENEQIFQKVVETGEPHYDYEKPFEYINSQERGITYWDWSLLPVKETNGEVSGLILSLVNVTRRKQAEIEFQKANEELEMRVLKRTKELAQANHSLQIEIAERRRAEEDARRALSIARERQAEITALLQASCAVLEQPSFRIAAQMILEASEQLLGAKGGYISLFDETRPDTEILIQDLAHLPYRPNRSGPIHASGLWELARYNRTTIYKNDFTKSKWAHSLPDGHFLPENILIAPLVVERAVLGFLILSNKPTRFNKNDANLATAFAELIAIALVKWQAEEGLRRARDELEMRVQERTRDLARVNEELRSIAVQNAQLYGAELHARQMAETLCTTSMALTQTLNLETVMNTLLDNVKHLVPYDSASLILLEDETRLVVRATHGYERWTNPNQDFTGIINFLTRLIALERISIRKKILIPDVQADPVWKASPDLEVPRNWLCVPLGVRDKLIGFCELSKDEPDFFTQEHVQLVEALAGQAAVAIQNAWLFEQLRTGRERLQSLSRRLVEVQETERRYIASELHDEAAQALTSLMLGLRLLERDADQPEAIVSRVAELKRMVQEVLENLHRLAMDLRPASLDHLGLVAALRQHLEAISDQHGLAIQFEIFGIEGRLPAEMETAFYRIVQEALTNVIRHARASRVDVLLEQRGDQIILIVEDDGIGFDPLSVTQSGRLGLFGMRERAEMLGGELNIESRPGNGTTISVEVPYALTNSYRR